MPRWHTKQVLDGTSSPLSLSLWFILQFLDPRRTKFFFPFPFFADCRVIFHADIRWAGSTP